MILKNGLVLVSGKLVNRDILIKKEYILAIEEEIKSHNDEVIDISGLMVVPGAIDVHVHLREPGFTEKETIKTGSLSAVKGGVTAMMAMPNTSPVPCSEEVARMIFEMVNKDALNRVFLYGSLSKDQKGKELSDVARMKPYIKALSDDGICVSNLGLLKDGMYAAKREGLIICSHAEAKEFGSGPEAEVRAVEREIEMVAETKCPYHFCHLSTGESIKAVRNAKNHGLDISCEVTPHHIFLCENTMQMNGNFKMSPPLRSLGDMRLTLAGLLSGFVDMVATDHAPHTEKEKNLGYELSPNGIIGLETLIPLMYTGLVRTGKITFEKMFDIITNNPAKRFNIPKGKLEIGGLADMAVLDLDELHVYSKDEILSKSKNSPFIGTELYGMNKMTIVNGEIKYKAIK